MKLLGLFAVFFKIGLFTFGGGYVMLPLIRQETLSRGWMDEQTLVRFIGICESTPGPIAVNMATFVGSTRAGLAGATCATLGVVLPALLVMLLIAAVLKGFRENALVRSAMSGIRPVVAGMILAAGLWTAVRCLLLQAGEGGATLRVDMRQICIALTLGAGGLIWRRALKKPFSPILLILFSAACGIVAYGF
ncbi:MAG: chromate transporter [Clostridia bacterium]|nr:chromate transporter [Clostridia bacterium]